VLAHLQSEQYDVMHYAGHALFDPSAPGQSGLLCSDEVLRASDLLALRGLPALLFFNACESGRLRRAAPRQAPAGIGLAEAFMQHGVMHYVGTSWPVHDAAASRFAAVFYGRLLGGAPIGAALVEARRAVRTLPSIDWADYVHYGDPAFTLKAGSGAAPATA